MTSVLVVSFVLGRVALVRPSHPFLRYLPTRVFLPINPQGLLVLMNPSCRRQIRAKMDLLGGRTWQILFLFLLGTR
jgi:hypothetical protein